MKTKILFIAVMCFCSVNLSAAIFYNGNMLVDEYSPKGICKLEQSTKGILTLAAVELSEEGNKAIKELTFQVAIMNSKSNTMYIYTDQPVKSVKLEDVLSKCVQGDKIVIMTTDRKFTLPHHEIEIGWNS